MRKHWVEFISVIDSIPPFINFIFAIVKTNAAIMGSSMPGQVILDQAGRRRIMVHD